MGNAGPKQKISAMRGVVLLTMLGMLGLFWATVIMQAMRAF
jgi:hypothetical protein